MLPSRSEITVEAIGMVSTSLQQRQYIYLTSFFAMSAFAPIEIPFPIPYVINRQPKRKYV